MSVPFVSDRPNAEGRGASREVPKKEAREEMGEGARGNMRGDRRRVRWREGERFGNVKRSDGRGL